MACAFFAEFNKIQKDAFRKAITNPAGVIETKPKIEQPTKVQQKPRGRPSGIKKINPIIVTAPTIIDKIQTSTSSVEFSSSSSSINLTASPIEPQIIIKVPRKIIKVPANNYKSPSTKETPAIVKQTEFSPKTPTIIQKESPKTQQNHSGKRKRQTSFKEVDESLHLSDGKANRRRRTNSATDSSFYETPRRSFMRPSLNANGQDSGLRRGRSKHQANLSAVEVPEKSFDEYNQEEFLCIFGLLKVVNV